MPIRKIPRSYVCATGRVPSQKAEGMVAFEGTLERDFYIRLEFDPTVLHFEGQPVQVDYVDGKGRSRHYTPDALVRYHDDPVTGPRKPHLCEVKPHDLLRRHWGEFLPRFQAAQRYARERGWLFRIYSERRIRSPLLANARFLLPYRSRSRSAEAEARVLAHLRACGPVDVNGLLAACADTRDEQAALLPSVWALVARFDVGCDLTAPISMHTLLWWSGSPAAGDGR